MGKSAPKAPDPVATAAAQSGANRDTAISQGLINMTNQITPYGNLTYNQTGTNSYVDSLTGKTVTVPQFTATQTLSPEQQAILDKTTAAETNLANIAAERSNFLQDYLKEDFNVDSAVEDKLYELGSSRLDPRFQRQEEQLRTQLIASGIRPGTAAYSSAMNDFRQTRNDAYNQLALTGRNQAFQEAAYERSAPINEIGALLNGSQVQNPNFVNTPQSQVAGTDYTGLVNNSYNAKVQSQNAMMGGLFGLAGTLGLGALKYSDRRLKTDILETKKRVNGLPVYLYRYVWDDKSSPLRVGVMAQDVIKVMPEAVAKDASGFYKVDYGMILEAA